MGEHLSTAPLDRRTPYDQLQPDQLCLWSLKSVNVFPRPLGTWMSLQAKSQCWWDPRYDPSQGKVQSALHALQAALPELVGFLLKEGSAPVPLSNSFSDNAN